MRLVDAWTDSMTNEDKRPEFAICVANDGCDDLSVGMIYRVLPDGVADIEGLMRVIDDSGEDYLYPKDRFVVVSVSPAEESRLLAVAPANVA